MSKHWVKRSVCTCVVALAGVVLVAGCANPGEEKKPAAMSEADQKAMMDAYMKAAQPGPEHARLKEFAGTWAADSQSWNPDGSSCGTGKGTMTNKMILGDRYLQMNFTGEMNSPQGVMPFNGMGIAGYDNATKQYFNIWIDDMGTGMMNSHGTVIGNVQTSEGSFNDPISGKPLKTKEILTVVDKDHQTFVLMMQPTPDAPLYKCMEMKYTKKN